MTGTFPELPGLAFDVKKTPMFSTHIQKAISGRELRAPNWVYPLYKWSLSYDVLRQAQAYGELQALMGFYMTQAGAFDRFLYRDPTDCAVTGQFIATTDGAAYHWQLVRSLGPYVEPIFAPDIASVAIYLNGSIQPPGFYTCSPTGLITWYYASPAAGYTMTADFTYKWNVRFAEDSLEFNNFMKQLWEAQTVELMGVRV